MEVKYLKNPIMAGVKILIKHSDHVGPFLKSQIYRGKSLRVSIAALARIEINNKFLLVRNRHRPGYFCPLGGVIKHFPSAAPVLDHLDFELERKAAVDQDLKDDLRGWIPGENLGPLLLWLNEERDRESATDALRREIEEETGEAEMNERIQRALANLRFRRIRAVHEGPYTPHSLSFPQYRRLEVFAPSSDICLKELQHLFSEQSNQSNLNYCLATREEIECGRLSQCHPDTVSGMEVLPNASYLFRSKLQKNEAAAI
ncbi:SMODS-associated NUDIX domain-containing protein [Leisingera sp. ANG-S5]|uniref:SMODS-associated NUDIX domain-containing protein n=1 Tax=Leisingera sp. ANG-S5 TaxID=1577901 RepID=UPI001269A6E5|nr:hypothetical protein [Leisingera sp. ANG-S5]